MIKKEKTLEIFLPLLILMGGFSYHLLFEGKSQYILTYIVLLIPYAAYIIDLLLKYINKFKKAK